jgi:hypothetical protein
MERAISMAPLLSSVPRLVLIFAGGEGLGYFAVTEQKPWLLVPRHPNRDRLGITGGEGQSYFLIRRLQVRILPVRKVTVAQPEEHRAKLWSLVPRLTCRYGKPGYFAGSEWLGEASRTRACRAGNLIAGGERQELLLSRPARRSKTEGTSVG